MNKQHFDSLYNYAMERTPVNYRGIYVYDGFYSFMCPAFVFHGAEKPAGHDIETDVPQWERIVRSVENKSTWKTVVMYETEFFKCSLRGFDREKIQIANDYWVDKKLVYRIARIIDLHEIKIPCDNRHPCLLIGKNGYAYLMPVRMKKGCE